MCYKYLELYGITSRASSPLKGYGAAVENSGKTEPLIPE